VDSIATPAGHNDYSAHQRVMEVYWFF